MKGLKDASLKLYPEGTVLMSSRAPVGYLAIATKELTTNQGFKSFIPDKKYDKTIYTILYRIVLRLLSKMLLDQLLKKSQQLF